MMPNVPPEEWDADQALTSLTMDGEVFDETSGQALQRLTESASPMAMQSIIQLAMRSRNENVRLRASQYIVDRVLGPVASPNGEGAKTNPLEAFLGTFVKDVESFANEGGGDAS